MVVKIFSTQRSQHLQVWSNHGGRYCNKWCSLNVFGRRPMLDTDWQALFAQSLAVLFHTLTLKPPTKLPALIIVFIEHWALSIIVPKNDKIWTYSNKKRLSYYSVDNSVYSFRNIERIEYQIDHHKIHLSRLLAIPVSEPAGCLIGEDEWGLNLSQMNMSRLRPFKKHEVSMIAIRLSFEVELFCQ